MGKLISRVGALVLCAGLGAALVPGCVIRIGPGTGEETEPGTTGGSSGGKTDPPPKTDEELAAETFAQLDPEELAFASARAGVTTTFLVGKIESLGLDPTTLDDAAMLQLMEQYLPAAAQEADTWLSTIDKSTLPTQIVPRYQCEEDFGCVPNPKCEYGVVPTVKHRCWVIDCGDAKCKSCPDWVGYLLSHIIYKSWCAYICAELGTSPPKIIAYGAGAISSFKNIYLGPLCMSHP